MIHTVYKVVHKTSSGILMSIATVPQENRVVYTPHQRTVGRFETPVLTFDTYTNAFAFAQSMSSFDWGVEVWESETADCWYIDVLCGQMCFDLVQWWRDASYRAICSSYQVPQGTLAAGGVTLKHMVKEVSPPWRPHPWS